MFPRSPRKPEVEPIVTGQKVLRSVIELHPLIADVRVLQPRSKYAAAHLEGVLDGGVVSPLRRVIERQPHRIERSKGCGRRIVRSERTGGNDECCGRPASYFATRVSHVRVDAPPAEC